MSGRFAPSPSGPLHAGSLLAALGSWLDARARAERWQLRIEDIDPQREVPGAARDIAQCLTAHGLHWDGEISFQSQRRERYNSALQRLQTHLFCCECSRRSLRGIHYPGTCHNRRDFTAEGAWRLRVEDRVIHFVDARRGALSQNVAQEVGDFIVRRRDAWPAYQLAVVVDDAEQGITSVVRGRDLLDNTARQCYLQDLLGYPRPRVLHLPLAEHADGSKLSKHTGAPAVDQHTPVENLRRAWQQLQGSPAPQLALQPLLAWCVEHWRVEAIGLK